MIIMFPNSFFLFSHFFLESMRFQSRFKAFPPFAICAAQSNSAYCVHRLPIWEVIFKYYPSPKRQNRASRVKFAIMLPYIDR